MVPYQMIVRGILRDDEAEMALAERNDLRQAFGLDRPDEPLGVRSG